MCLKLNNTQLELLEFENNDFDTAEFETGTPHFAFEASRLKASKQALEAKGVDFLSDMNIVTEGILAGWHWTYFSDPDGRVIERVEAT